MKYSANFCRPGGRNRLRAEAYIHKKGERDATKAIFDALHDRRQEIEEVVGESLDWDRLNQKQAARISLYYPDEIRVTDEDHWPKAREWLVEAMGRMQDAFNPAIKDLRD